MFPRKNLITGRIVGGLGNQLFIWAATNYYANKLKKEPTFHVYEKEKFQLDKILIVNLKHTQLSIFKLRIVELTSRLIRIKLLSRKVANSVFGIYSQHEIGLASENEPDKNSTYLIGYFQSWKYSQNLGKSTIRRDFDLDLNSIGAIEAREKFHADGGVAVHIRLGDYLNSENHYFGILAPTYYVNSLMALGVCPGTTVWVFTDSLELAKSEYSKALESQFNLFWASETFELTTIEEFKLLASSRKIVIANSTFSWWAAFLAREDCKTVCPSKWFRFADDPKQLVPEQWEIVESIWRERKI